MKKFDKKLLKAVSAKSSVKTDMKANLNMTFSKVILISRDSKILKRLIFIFSHFIRSGNFDDNWPAPKEEEDCQVIEESLHDGQRNSKENYGLSLVNLSSIIDEKEPTPLVHIENRETNKYENLLHGQSNEKLPSPSQIERKVSFTVGAAPDKTSQFEATCFTKHPPGSALQNERTEPKNQEYALMVPLPKSLK